MAKTMRDHGISLFQILSGFVDRHGMRMTKAALYCNLLARDGSLDSPVAHECAEELRQLCDSARIPADVVAWGYAVMCRLRRNQTPEAVLSQLRTVRFAAPVQRNKKAATRLMEVAAS